jgi:preprotein translocase subunit SecG
MSSWFLVLTVLFIVVSAVMILIILVQRPQGGGLAGAFGGAGGGSTDTVFGGRVGDALTLMTVFAFAGYVLLAIGLNIMDPSPAAPTVATPAAATQPADSSTPITPIDANPPTTDGSSTNPPAGDGGATNPPAIDMSPIIPALPETPPATSPAGGGAA